MTEQEWLSSTDPALVLRLLDGTGPYADHAQQRVYHGGRENTHSDNLIWQQTNRPHVRGCWAVDLLLGKE